MLSILIIVGILAVIGFIILNQPQFGKNPSKERLERIKKSPNYKDGSFQNLSPTPAFTSDKSRISTMYDILFKKSPDLNPPLPIKSIKTDLKSLPIEQNLLVWFGHSGYFIQLDGKRYLIDPTLLTASPFSFYNTPFAGADSYQPKDIPPIDYLIITHDHYDHLDYQTIMQLKDNVGTIITGLGVGSHFEYWGFPKEKIIELDWQESINLPNITLTCLPARHFSGRGFVRNQTLWASFMLESVSKTIYIGGDSGYDPFYKEIGKKYQHIDLALLENGQYNEDWALIHILPEQIPQVIKDIKPKRILTGHNSKYALSNHSWSEPLNKIYNSAKKENFHLITPQIGEIVDLDNESQTFDKWW